MPDVQMQPGNRDPGRYRKTTLSLAMVALITAGASAPQLLDQFLNEKEGVRLTAYRDGKGLWTVCRGLTHIAGKPVTQGMRFTREECDRLDREEVKATLAELQRIVKPEVWASLSEPAKAGLGSFCVYNIGTPLCLRSTFLRELNAKATRNETCAQITNWIRDGGKDCRKAGSGCQGQPGRRMQEDELCLVPKGDAP
jgi:lysozyme